MDLVIQGREVENTDLKHLAKLSGASRIEGIGASAFRLRGARPAAGIDATCARAHLDYAFVPEDRRLANFGLLVMDMDSTLITIETIDELADMASIKPQVATITAQAMRGEIEYDESLRRRLALLKGLDETALARVYNERLELAPGAERMLSAVKKHGIKTLLVSGGFTYVTDRLKSRLGLDYTHSNILGVEHGRLTGAVVGSIVNAAAKCDALLGVRNELRLTRSQVIGIGDGANDLKFLLECGVSIAYHAKPVVREQTMHAIDHVGLDGILNLFN